MVLGLNGQQLTLFFIKHLIYIHTHNEDKDVLAIYIDSKEAFDTLNHAKLINKFKFFNFDDNLTNLLSSYLKNRNQCTRINGECSERMDVTYAGLMLGI